jgi:hypothetical protein
MKKTDRLCLGLLVVVLGFGALATHVQAQDASYLPLDPGSKWVLRNAREKKPVIFEVVQQDGNGVRVRSTTPWGMSEWTLAERKRQFFMTEYGTGSGMMPIPEGTLYFDFARSAGTEWSNSLGTLSIASTRLEVKSASQTYPNSVQIRHKHPGGASVFTFAKGIGFVQFGEGSGAFVLDESASNLPGPRGTKASEPEAPPPARPRSSGGRILFGLTANRMANEPETPEVLIKRFNQTLQTGAGFVVANGNWTELEPADGKYKLDSLNYLLSVSKQLPVSYTLRIIDTVGRNVPSNLRRTRWNDRKMRSRLFKLIDAMTPLLKGRVRWFMLGYEINEYMNRNPREAKEFIELYRATAAYVRNRVPGIQVSTTLMFSGIDQLDGRLAGMNQDLDFIALTYAPLKGDFSVMDPSVLPGDFQKMKRVAAGRKVVLQEIGYPTSSVVGSSEEKQAEFYRLAFQQIERDPQAFDAVNWMMLADLSDATTKHYSEFYGLKGAAKFEAVLQTMGLFDSQGRPKKSWEILRKEFRR